MRLSKYLGSPIYFTIPVVPQVVEQTTASKPTRVSLEEAVETRGVVPSGIPRSAIRYYAARNPDNIEALWTNRNGSSRNPDTIETELPL